jgi:hypothetical protein
MVSTVFFLRACAVFAIPTVKKKPKTERNTPLIPPRFSLRKREPKKEETADPRKWSQGVSPCGLTTGCGVLVHHSLTSSKKADTISIPNWSSSWQDLPK